MSKERPLFFERAFTINDDKDLHSVIGKPQSATNPEWFRNQYTKETKLNNGFYSYFFGYPSKPENWKHFWCFMIKHHTKALPFEWNIGEKNN